MQFTPSQATEHPRDPIASYIEPQYRFSHPLVFAEQLRQATANGLQALAHA